MDDSVENAVGLSAFRFDPSKFEATIDDYVRHCRKTRRRAVIKHGDEVSLIAREWLARWREIQNS